MLTRNLAVFAGPHQSGVCALGVDSYGETLQTQASAEGGGAVVSDVTFDSAGRAVAAENNYWATITPSTTLFTPSSIQNINNRTATTYDGAGRATQVQLYNGTTLTSTTKTVYSGDRVTLIPPAGGVETTTVTDPAGQTVETDRWTSPPAISSTGVISGGTANVTSYTFDAAGRQTSETTAKGTAQAATFATTYDLAGRAVAKDDPDTGSSTIGYDDTGAVTSTTDARGDTVATAYDADGRVTGTFDGSLSGTELTKTVWDTLQVGQRTSVTSYVAGNAYTTAATGYDGAGRPTGSSVSFSLPGFASSYTSQMTWTKTESSLV